MKCAMRNVESSDEEEVETFPVILLMQQTSKILNHFLKYETLIGFVWWNLKASWL